MSVLLTDLKETTTATATFLSCNLHENFNMQSLVVSCEQKLPPTFGCSEWENNMFVEYIKHLSTYEYSICYTLNKHLRVPIKYRIIQKHAILCYM